MQLAIRSYIDDSGKLVIPIKLRRQLNLKPRDKVSIACSGNKLTVTSFQSNIEEARNILAKYGDKDLLGDLKSMRKEEFEKEEYVKSTKNSL